AASSTRSSARSPRRSSVTRRARSWSSRAPPPQTPEDRRTRELLSILRAGGVYGAARVSRMHEEHLNEHALLREALVGHDLGVISANLRELAEALRAHMDAEERTFLHAGVLGNP